MSDFSVEPNDLDSYARLLGRSVDDIDAALEYIEKQCSISTMDQGPLSTLASIAFSGHESIISGVKTSLKSLRTHLKSSKSEVALSATYYRETEFDEAKRMDATYSAPRVHHRTGGGSRGFADKVEPTKRLQTPKIDGDKDEPDGGLFKKALETGNVLSPSWVISKGLELAFDFNPVDEAKKLLAGDWEAFAACAKAWSYLGEFCDDVSTNILAGNIELDSTWNGNGGDSAYKYFSDLARDVAKFKDSFESLKSIYEDLYKAVYQTAEACGDLLSGILDLAAVVGMTAAAGAATSFTLFGPMIAAGAVATEITVMINKWTQLTTVIAGCQTTASGLLGVTGLYDFWEAKQVSFPKVENSYNHPAVPNK
ncbi:hypothetical protein ACFW95_26235 [Streptomyces sp. NPDC059474]|uniref:hypothetical protein n=1 Tax=unclassified Streptomyces TaxID=2593676 RepID=UPI0033FD4A17